MIPIKVNVYTSNSFAKINHGGNPAGVVLAADDYSEAEMKKIAASVGFSETAFVSNSNVADYHVRFFTPTEEVDLCGHATIAAFYTMVSLDRLKAGKYTQETRAGILGIEVEEDGFVWMNQSLPMFSEILDKQKIAESLKIDVTEISENLSVQIVSTGLRDIFVPVKNRDVLNALEPDLAKVKEISAKYGTIGYHVFCMGDSQNKSVSCRNFAPLYGISEEAATGTSSGALACYLYHYGQIREKQAAHLIFEQGRSMKRDSEIIASLQTEEQKIKEERVGGKAKNLTLIEVEI